MHLCISLLPAPAKSSTSPNTCLFPAPANLRLTESQHRFRGVHFPSPAERRRKPGIVGLRGHQNLAHSPLLPPLSPYSSYALTSQQLTRFPPVVTMMALLQLSSQSRSWQSLSSLPLLGTPLQMAPFPGSPSWSPTVETVFSISQLLQRPLHFSSGMITCCPVVRGVIFFARLSSSLHTPLPRHLADAHPTSPNR